MRRALTFLALGLFLAVAPAPAKAQNWADSLFPEPQHDFGVVARGSKLKYTFWLVNNNDFDVQIVGTRPKCGCTDVKVGARSVPPGTRTPIEATLDTTKFQGRKDSGLTIQLNGPSYAEKDLNIGCFIRGDVLLNPGVIDFGRVARGAKPVTVLNLSYLGGQPGWALTGGGKTASKDLSVEVKGPFQASGGGIQYQLTATLDAATPPGFFKDTLTLPTNDPSVPTIPINVTAEVQAAVVVSPGNLVLGRVKAGQTVTKTVLVRSVKPFKITGTKSAKDELSASKPGDAEAPSQMLTITLKAPAQTGPYNGVIEISTNLKDEPPAKLTAFATIVP